jgi:hypothetical protein
MFFCLGAAQLREVRHLPENKSATPRHICTKQQPADNVLHHNIMSVSGCLSSPKAAVSLLPFSQPGVKRKNQWRTRLKSPFRLTLGAVFTVLGGMFGGAQIEVPDLGPFLH